jgi:hypothetical protein
MEMNSITVIYDIGMEIGVANELLKVQSVIGNVIWVQDNLGRNFNAKMNKAGTRILKHSVRRDFN